MEDKFITFTKILTQLSIEVSSKKPPHSNQMLEDNISNK